MGEFYSMCARTFVLGAKGQRRAKETRGLASNNHPFFITLNPENRKNRGIFCQQVRIFFFFPTLL
jgi:hypothetical protein